MVTTNCEVVFFVSSSGHCSLNCAYCVARPVVKNEPSITYEDLAFLLEQTGKRTFFGFSGRGDFFAGYRKSDRFLERLLQHDVEVALDINGVIIHELPELPVEAVRKIRSLNLTMHYAEIKRTGVLAMWADHAVTAIRRVWEAHGPWQGTQDYLLVDFVASPAERELWVEALELYEREVFAATRQRIVLVRDCMAVFTPSDDEAVASLARRFESVVERVHQEDFSELFPGHRAVLCPAGARYFRIWNDGTIQGCPFVPTLLDCGNVKQRLFLPRSGSFLCRDATHCDCNAIALLGKMEYPSKAQDWLDRTLCRLRVGGRQRGSAPSQS
jgi:MoaA/NifB/PqqE/SkfB family radical SAM enzyme